MRKRDSFGHSIGLNFDRDGNSRGTVLGGFVTLLVELILLYYMAVKSKAFVLH